MSSSMYEVFHWNSTSEPTYKPIQSAKSLSCAHGSEPLTTLAKTDPQVEVATKLSLNLEGHDRNILSAPHTPSNRSVHISSILPGFGSLSGGEWHLQPRSMLFYFLVDSYCPEILSAWLETTFCVVAIVQFLLVLLNWINQWEGNYFPVNVSDVHVLCEWYLCIYFLLIYSQSEASLGFELMN